MQVRLWNRALSAEEVRQSIFQPADVSDESLVAYYDFNELHSGRVVDKAWMRNNGILGADTRKPASIVSDAPVFTPCLKQSQVNSGLLTHLRTLVAEQINSVKVLKRRASPGKPHLDEERKQIASPEDRLCKGGQSVELTSSQIRIDKKQTADDYKEGEEIKDDVMGQGFCASNGTFDSKARREQDPSFQKISEESIKAHDQIDSGGFDLGEVAFPSCLEVTFRRGSMSGERTPHVIHVDVSEQCDKRPLHPDSCWGIRTEVGALLLLLLLE